MSWNPVNDNEEDSTEFPELRSDHEEKIRGQISKFKSKKEAEQNGRVTIDTNKDDYLECIILSNTNENNLYVEFSFDNKKNVRVDHYRESIIGLVDDISDKDNYLSNENFTETGINTSADGGDSNFKLYGIEFLRFFESDDSS